VTEKPEQLYVWWQPAVSCWAALGHLCGSPVAVDTSASHASILTLDSGVTLGCYYCTS